MRILHLAQGSRNEYGAPDSLPISVATAATSGRTTSVGDTSSSSEVRRMLRHICTNEAVLNEQICTPYLWRRHGFRPHI
jgi:hypothetical protein